MDHIRKRVLCIGTKEQFDRLKKDLPHRELVLIRNPEDLKCVEADLIMYADPGDFVKRNNLTPEQFEDFKQLARTRIRPRK